MDTYLVMYRIGGDPTTRYFYTFQADDAEHALEQFRSAEPRRYPNETGHRTVVAIFLAGKDGQ